MALTVTFLDGPLRGARPLGFIPDRLFFWRHRKVGATVIDRGTMRLYDVAHDPAWERLHYLRVGRRDDGADYAYAGAPPACLSGWLDGVYTEVDNCQDPSHDHFWMPKNWPSDLAPIRWKTRTPDHDWIKVETWVRLASGECECWDVAAFGSATGDRWEPGTYMNDVRSLIRMEGELRASVAEFRAGVVDLAETQAGAGALPG